MRIKGIDLDTTELDLPDGSAVIARNVVVSKKAGAYSNEDGNELKSSLSEPICGKIELDDSRTILFSSDIDGTGSEIGIESSDGVYSTIIKDDALNFSWDRPIKGVATRNGLNQTVISWCEGVELNSNPLRILNIDNIGISLTSGKAFVNSADVDLLRLFPKINVPVFNLTKIEQTGGTLNSGTYYMTFRYKLLDGSTSNFVGSSGPIYIIDDIETTPVPDGCEANTETTKAISFALTSLSDEYSAIEVALISKIGGVMTAKVLGEFSYTGTSTSLTITGSEIGDTISLDEVLVPTIAYNKAAAMTVLEGRLNVAKLETAPEIDYQKYANNIKIKWIANDNGYVNRYYGSANNETWIHFNKQFRSDEVYAFYIHLNFTNGTKSPAYHIPGRAPFPSDKSAANSKALQVDANGMTYQFADTSFNNGVMGFWENVNETYPETSDFDVWSAAGMIGTLQGENVRHHKFPTQEKLGSYNKHMVHKGSDNDTHIRPLGIEAYNIHIPAELVGIVESYEISYAKRTIDNTTVVSSSVIDKVEKGTSNRNVITNARTYPFELMKDQAEVPITHCVLEYYMQDNASWQRSASSGVLWNPLDIGNVAINTEGWFKGFGRKIMPVSSSFILLTGTVNKNGFSNYDESYYLVKFKSAETLTTMNSIESFTTAQLMSVVSLRSHKTNVYRPFYEQELVTINKVFKINNYYTAVPYSTGTIYGGDTYMCMQSVKTKRDGFGALIPTYPQTNYYPLESSVNISLRHNDEDIVPSEVYYPKDGDITQMTFDHYTYNDDYSALNDIFQVYPFNSNNKENLTNKQYYRIARSFVQGTENITLKWRNFSALDYYEMPKNTGYITDILGSGRDMYILTENTFYIAEIKDKLQSVDTTTIFVGDGDIFDRLPTDMSPNTNGLYGCQDRFSTTLCKLGLVWVNRLHRKVFIFNKGEGVKEISKQGMYNFMRDNLNVFESSVRDNPFRGSGISTCYDEENNRLFINKIDVNGDSFSLSYSPDLWLDENTRGGFVSFHDRRPYFMYNKRNELYSIRANGLSGETWRENVHGVKGRYYGTRRTSYIDIIFNNGIRNSKIWQSLHWYSDFIKDGKVDYYKTFDRIMMYNKNSCSGVISLENTNLVRTEEGWNYNDFRDIVTDTNIQLLDEQGEFIATLNSDIAWFKKGRFISKYIIARLMTNNTDNYEMQLSDISIEAVKSDR